MALKPVVNQEAFSSLPQAVQAEYNKQDDGTYLLSVVAESGYELSDVSPLRNTLGRQKDTIASLKEELSTLKEAMTTTEAQLEKLRKENPDVDEQVQTHVAEIKAKLTADLEAAQAQIAEKDKLVKKHVLEATASAAISKAGGNVDLLMPHVLGRLRVENVDGTLKVVPVQSDGKTWMSLKSGSTEAGSVDELIGSNEFKTSPVFASCFKADRPSGGTDSNPQSSKLNADGKGNDNSNNSNNNNNLTPSQRLAIIRKSGSQQSSGAAPE